MNYFLCHNNKKKSQGNIDSISPGSNQFNRNDLFTNDNTNGDYILENLSNINTSNLNIEENKDLHMKIKYNIDENSDEELMIIDYPYMNTEKSSNSIKLKPKELKNIKSKFNVRQNIEEKILNKLNHFDTEDNNNTKKNKKSNLKRYNKNKELITNNDPSDMALFCLIKKQKEINQEKNTNNEGVKEDDILTLEDSIEFRNIGKFVVNKIKSKNSHKRIKKNNFNKKSKNEPMKKLENLNNKNENKIICTKSIFNKSGIDKNILKKINNNNQLIQNNLSSNKIKKNAFYIYSQKKFQKSRSSNLFDSNMRTNKKNSKNKKNNIIKHLDIQNKNNKIINHQKQYANNSSCKIIKKNMIQKIKE